MNGKMRCASALVAAVMMFGGCADKEPAKRSFFAMDTYINITAYGDNGEKAAQSAQELVYSLEEQWSVTREDSDVGRINSSNGQPVSVSENTAELISYALSMYDRTDGALDISVYPIVKEWGFTTGDYKIPDSNRIGELLGLVNAKDIAVKGNSVTLKKGMMIDLGAVAKGYASDLVAQQLKNDGVSAAIIDLGGNIRAVGTKPDGSDWRIGLRSPTSDGIFATLSVGEGAVVTSGSYERYFTSDGKRYCHIIDPKTGAPAESRLMSVTIIAPEGRLCDALSTALFVLGADKAEELYRKSGGFEYVIVTADFEIIMTPGIADRIELDPSVSDRRVTVIK